MNKIDKDDIQHYHEYPKLEGKSKKQFEFQPNLINKIKHNIYELYSKSNLKNPILSSQIHNIILKLFIDDYYPLQTQNIKTDNKTTVVIMGGYAFNMNIPNKMNKILYTETNDIDTKIYTTEINNIVKKSYKLDKLLYIFKYLIIIICFYIKQIFTIMINYSKIIFESNEPYIKKSSHSKKTNKYKANLSLKSKTKSKQNIETKTKKIIDNQKGGEIKNNSHLIKNKQKRFGILKSYKIKIKIIKKGQETEVIDITDLSYDDTYKLIMKKIVDPDILITTKISYSLKYINLIIPYSNKSRLSITFSDTKIIYPNIHNPSFYTYYFMNNRKQLDENIKLDKLLTNNINISEIINTKNCKYNCNYISIKCLQVDIIYMLYFAELLDFEDLTKGIVLVPIESLYKYYKYLIKYIRIHIIRKFFNGTLANNKMFIDTARKLIRYTETNLKKATSQLGETLPINILYKNIISEFHQAFFIKKTMFPEYEALSELVKDYNTTVYFINRSCSLFKKLDDEDEKSGETIESISIQVADKQIADKQISNKQNVDNILKSKIIMSGGILNEKQKQNQFSKNSKIILHDNYSFDDIELDNLNNNINKIKSKTYKMTPSENKIIIDKLHKMLNNEIQFLGKLSHSIKK